MNTFWGVKDMCLKSIHLERLTLITKKQYFILQTKIETNNLALLNVSKSQYCLNMTNVTQMSNYNNVIGKGLESHW